MWEERKYDLEQINWKKFKMLLFEEFQSSFFEATDVDG